MPVVRNTTRGPSGTAIPRAMVRIRLVAGDNITDPGYTSDGTVVSVVTVRANAAGLWQVTLPANTTITPSGTYYEVVETDPVTRAEYPSTIEVPNGSGPYQLSAILVTAPEPPSMAAVPTSRAINTTAPLSGGGPLDTDRTIAVADATTSSTGVVQLAGDLAGIATAPTVPGLAGKETPSGAQAKVDTHAAATDPHGDRAYAAGAVTTHTAASDPHGDRAFARYAILSNSPAAGVLTALYRGQSTVIQMTGDSTGDGTGVTVGDPEWFYLLGNKLGQKFPNYNVARMQWNDTNSNYDPLTYVQNGPSGKSYMTLTGTASGLKWQAAAITGDLRVEVEVRMVDYTPASSQILAAQYTSSGNQVSWYFGIGTNGRPFFAWSTDGTTTVTSKSATAAPTATDGVTIIYLAAEHDVDDGAGNNLVKFYTSSDGTNWTQLGSTITTAGTTSHFNSTGPYTIGSRDSSHALPAAGDFFSIRIRNGLGTTGSSVVPPLVDTWTNTTAVSSPNAYPGGSPTLLMVNGSQGGKDITSYFNDATRLPRLFAPKRQNLIFLSSGQNDDNLTGQDWINTYSTWVGNIKALLPGVPIVSVTQDPPQNPPRNPLDVWARTCRGTDLTTWSKSQTGVYVVDTWPAFTDPSTQINSDGVHPLGPGSQAWCDYVYNSLFVTLG